MPTMSTVTETESIIQAEFPGNDLDATCIGACLVETIARALHGDAAFEDLADEYPPAAEFEAMLNQGGRVLAALIQLDIIRCADLRYDDRDPRRVVRRP